MKAGEPGQSRLWCESTRLLELAHYNILDTAQEPQFDRLVMLACTVFDTPMAAVTLVDHDRQWFKARHGLNDTQTSRAESFCSHVIAVDDVLVVPDARLDRRFADNPLVTGAPHIRFYAGAPIRSARQINLGALCIISDTPRAHFSAADQRLLQMLAELVESELELRLCAYLTQRAYSAVPASST